MSSDVERAVAAIRAASAKPETRELYIFQTVTRLFEQLKSSARDAESGIAILLKAVDYLVSKNVSDFYAATTALEVLLQLDLTSTQLSLLCNGSIVKCLFGANDSVSPTVIEATIKVFGAAISKNAARDFVAKQTEDSLTWITADARIDSKRICGLMALCEIVRYVPMMFIPHITTFFDSIWKCLMDPSGAIKERAKAAFEVVISLLNTRPREKCNAEYTRLMRRLLEYLDEGRRNPQSSEAKIVGALMVLETVVLNAKRNAESSPQTVAETYTRISTALRVLGTQQKSLVVRLMAIRSYPVLAKYDVKTFIAADPTSPSASGSAGGNNSSQNSNGANSTARLTLKEIIGMAATMSRQEAEVAVTYEMLSQLIEVVGPKAIRAHDGTIASAVQTTLIELSRPPAKPPVWEALGCLATLCRVAPSDTVLAYVKACINRVFTWGLSRQFIQYMGDIIAACPADLQAQISDNILDIVSLTLSGLPFRQRSDGNQFIETLQKNMTAMTMAGGAASGGGLTISNFAASISSSLHFSIGSGSGGGGGSSNGFGHQQGIGCASSSANPLLMSSSSAALTSSSNVLGVGGSSTGGAGGSSTTGGGSSGVGGGNPLSPGGMQGGENELIALCALNEFNLANTELMGDFLRDSVLSFVDSPNTDVRLAAISTISRLLLPAGEVAMARRIVISTVITRLLVIASADPNLAIRLAILKSFTPQFYAFLAETHFLSFFFTSLSDESREIRVESIELLCKMLSHNRSHILPALRKELVDLMHSLLNARANTVLEQSLVMLEKMASIVPEFIADFVDTVSTALRKHLPMLTSSSPLLIPMCNTLTAVAYAGEKDLAATGISEAAIGRLIAVMANLGTDRVASHTRLTALRTLTALIKYSAGLGLVYKRHPGLYKAITRAFLNSDELPEVRLAALKAMGVAGAVDPHRLATYEAEESEESQLAPYLPTTEALTHAVCSKFVLSGMSCLFDPRDSRFVSNSDAVTKACFKTLLTMCENRCVGNKELELVFPSIIANLMTMKETRLYCTILFELSTLIKYAGPTVLKHDDLFRELFDYVWRTSPSLRFTVVHMSTTFAVVGRQAMAGGSRHNSHIVPVVLDQLVDTVESEGLSQSILEFFMASGPALQPLSKAVVSTFIAILDKPATSVVYASQLIGVLRQLARHITLTEFASTLVRTVCAKIGHYYDRSGPTASEFSPIVTRGFGLFVLIQSQIKGEFLKFVPIINRVAKKHGIRHFEYASVVLQLSRGGKVKNSKKFLEEVESDLRTLRSEFSKSTQAAVEAHGELWGQGADGTIRVLHACDTTMRPVNEREVKERALSRAQTKDEYTKWLDDLAMVILTQSPFNVFRCLSGSATGFQSLAERAPLFVRNIFHVAFRALWSRATGDLRHALQYSFQYVLNARSGVPDDVVLALLSVCEHMDLSGSPMPIPSMALSYTAFQKGVDAKSLYWMEATFHATDYPVNCIDRLFSLYSKLGLIDSAINLLKSAGMGDQLTPLSLIKLGRFHEALAAIELSEGEDDNLSVLSSAKHRITTLYNGSSASNGSSIALPPHVGGPNNTNKGGEASPSRGGGGSSHYDPHSGAGSPFNASGSAMLVDSHGGGGRRGGLGGISGGLFTNNNSMVNNNSSSTIGSHSALLGGGGGGGSGGIGNGSNSGGGGGANGSLSGLVDDALDARLAVAWERVGNERKAKMHCWREIGEMHSVVNEWRSLFSVLDDIRLRDDEDSILSEVAPYAADAAIRLHSWEDVADTLRHMPREGNILFCTTSAALAIHNQQWDKAQSFVLRGREQLMHDCSALLNESYARAYDSVVLAQQLVELEETIACLRITDPEKRIAAVAAHASIWTDRISVLSPTVSHWNRILQTRGLLIPEQHDVSTRVMFVKLCRQMSPNSSLERFTLEQLLGSRSPSLEDLTDAQMNPRVVLEYVKYLSSSGELYEGGRFGDEKTVLRGLIGLHGDDPRYASLVARMYARCGCKSDLDEALDSFQTATELDPSWFRGWRYWSEANVQFLASRGYSQAHFVNAVVSFINAIRFGPSSSTVIQDVLKFLALWSRNCNDDRSLEVLEKSVSMVPVQTWLLVIPQLIARLDHGLDRSCDLVADILATVARENPHPLIAPLIVCAASHERRRREHAELILARMAGSNPTLIAEGRSVCSELIRISMVIHEQWHDALETAAKAYFGDGNTAENVEILTRAHLWMDRAPESIAEVDFHQKYGRLLQEAKEWLSSFKKTKRVADLNCAWQLYYHVYRQIDEGIRTQQKLELHYASPRLFEASNLAVAVPSQAQQLRKNVVTIASFKPTLKVIPSKQRPKRTAIIGSDGETYLFLLKGREDLRLDERVMQLFRLVNTVLFYSVSTNKIAGYQIQRYSVTPLWETVGLIGWVDECDTMHELIKSHRLARNVTPELEMRLMDQVICTEQPKAYDMLQVMSKTEVMEFLAGLTTGHDLRRSLASSVASSEVWLERRTTYTHSLATMSIVGYILGLGDRHPNNIMIQRSSGKVVHIDFGDCFEVAMTRDKFPEKVPFRMTRMLCNALEVFGEEGVFRSSAESVMTVLRENNETLLTMLEAFVQDPLISWRLVNKAGELPEEVETVAVAERMATVLNTEASEGASGGGTAGGGAAGAGAAKVASMTVTLDPSTGALTAHSPSVASPSVGNLNGGESAGAGTAMSPYTNGGASASAAACAPHEGVAIMRRLADKLKGCEYASHRSAANAMPPKEQVRRLIGEATDISNVAQSWSGWYPFW